MLVDRADDRYLRIAFKRFLQDPCQFGVSVIDMALEFLAKLVEHIAQG